MVVYYDTSIRRGHCGVPACGSILGSPPAGGRMSVRDQLNSYIRQLEKRLRLGALLRGAAILTSVALVATVVLVLITNALAFSRWSITSARVALLFALVLALTFGIALPVNALNRRRAARQAENVFPEFQQRLVTFAERDAHAREPFLELLA